MPLNPRLAVAWLAFLAAGTFFALMNPLGEGFDEPFHLAYLQYLVQTGNVPLGHSMHVSEQIDFFLHNQPVSWGLDRKSTRLNSSHRTISYAVFCLKKKTRGTSRPY